MGQRRDRLNKRIAAQIVTRRKNSLKKNAEHDRRDAQMKELISKGTFPYTPTVMSWASLKLDKKSHLITPDDLKKL